WYRPNMPPRHIHAVAIGDKDLVASARSQVADYYAGRNGLANKGRDDGPSAPRQTWEQYQASKQAPQPEEWLDMDEKDVERIVRRVVRDEVRSLLTWPTNVDGFTGRISLHQTIARAHNFARSVYMKLH